MGSIIAKDYATMMIVETALLLAGKRVNLGTYSRISTINQILILK